jgi:hypothetical protein
MTPQMATTSNVIASATLSITGYYSPITYTSGQTVAYDALPILLAAIIKIIVTTINRPITFATFTSIVLSPSCSI